MSSPSARPKKLRKRLNSMLLAKTTYNICGFLDKIVVSYIIPIMKDLLAIIDTNVLLSGLKSQKGQSYKLLQKLLNDEFEIAISVPLILEYEAILKKKLDRNIFSDQDIDSVINYLCKIGKQVKIFYLWRPFLKDPFDDHIIEVALSANCKYIITYNKKDFIDVEQFGVKVLTPYDFIKVMGG